MLYYFITLRYYKMVLRLCQKYEIGVVVNVLGLVLANNLVIFIFLRQVIFVIISSNT